MKIYSYPDLNWGCQNENLESLPLDDRNLEVADVVLYNLLLLRHAQVAVIQYFLHQENLEAYFWSRRFCPSC